MTFLSSLLNILLPIMITATAEVFDTQLGQYKLNFSKPLGRGTFGEVYRARHVDGGPVVALKRMVWNVDTSLLAIHPRQEVDSYKSVPSHDNIVKLIDHDLSERWV